jgi:8-oxo-dGTP pyrophosphatase MutT (NUDIX family)
MQPMDFHFIEQLQENLKKPLPGLKAQFLMAPKIRVPMLMEDYMKKNPSLSAVLILLYPEYGDWNIVLTQRHSYNGMHSNQVSLPGGKNEKKDQNTEQTAIREAEEELGIDLSSIRILGRISDLYIQPSNYLVHPYVGYITETPAFRPEPGEVKELIEVPLTDLLDPETIKEKTITVANQYSLDAPYFDLKGYVVWGATAMILSEFLSILKAE